MRGFTTWALAVTSVLQSEAGAPPALSRERQIPAKLDRVVVRVVGLEGGFWNGPGLPKDVDPETELTGLSRQENARLHAAILGDVSRTVTTAGLRSIDPSERDSGSLPLLELRLARWQARSRDFFVLEIELRLLEPARLVRDPEQVVSVPTWQRSMRGTADRDELFGKLRQGALDYAQEFAQAFALERSRRDSGEPPPR
jgi:hypothetical protein